MRIIEELQKKAVEWTLASARHCQIVPGCRVAHKQDPYYVFELIGADGDSGYVRDPINKGIKEYPLDELFDIDLFPLHLGIIVAHYN